MRPGGYSLRHRRLLAIPAMALVAGVLLGACGDDDGADEPVAVDQKVTSEIAREAEREERCQAVEKPEPGPRDIKRPGDLEPTPGNVTFETSCGAFTVELDTETAPQTTASVEYLVREGFYNGLSIHRVVPDFLIQGGDPLGKGTGGPGYSITERPPEDVAYPKWTVAMAKSQDDPAGTSGSQFFVVVTDDADIRPNQAVIGEVVAGFETVERIHLIGPPVDQGNPSIPVTIEKAVFYPSE